MWANRQSFVSPAVFRRQATENVFQHTRRAGWLGRVIDISACPTAAEMHRALSALHQVSKAVLVKGLPSRDEQYQRKIMDAVAVLLGQPRCYPASRYGPGPVHDMTEPMPPLVDDGLDWHTEDSFASMPPSFVALLCIKGDKQVRTHLRRLSGPGPGAATEGMIRPDPYLYGDRSAVRRPLAFAGERGTGWRYDPALITGCADSPHLCPRMEERKHYSLILEEGDLLVFNNHVLTHSRDGHGSKDSRRVLRMIIG
jgi:alpha-ketoglutarate-dependent taurine dioxygenase